MRLFDQGLRLVQRERLTQAWQIAMTIVASQAIRCLSAAWLLLFREYDTQPLALARLAGEYTLLLQYLSSHRDQAEAWINPSGPTPLTVGEIARQLEREGIETYPQSVRKLLHRFSHQDTLAIGMSVRIGDAKKNSNLWTLRVGDPSEHFRTIASLLLVENALLLLRLDDFLSGLDEGWDRAVARERARHLIAMNTLVAEAADVAPVATGKDDQSER
jgi:hypothetical protein